MRKKILAICTVLILLISFNSCGGDSGDTNPTTTTTTATKATTKPTTTPRDDSISWKNAYSHIGEKATVRGDVMGIVYSKDSNGQPTFINVGEDYPSDNRLTIVIWGEDRSSFPKVPERMYEGKSITVKGEITEYDGIAQIVVTSPSQIKIQK